MNQTDLNELLAVDSNRGDRFQGEAEDSADQQGEAAQRIIRSIRRRWWFYAIVTAIAVAAGFYVAKEYGTYTYTAMGLVRANRVPSPPGKEFYTPPAADEFGRYLGHPEVTEQLKSEFTLLDAEEQDAGNAFVEEEFDRKRKFVIVKSTRDDPDEASTIVNRAIEKAIEKSVEERKETLADLLKYYSGLVGKAETDAAAKRLAKAERLKTLKSRFADSKEIEIEFQELTRESFAREQRVEDLKAEVVQIKRVQALREANQKELVDRIRDHVFEKVRADLESEAERFAEGSRPAEALAEKRQEIDQLGEAEITSREELRDLLSDVFGIVGKEFGLPSDDASRLREIGNELYKMENQLALLPQRIEDAEEDLQAIEDRRAEVRPVAEDDLEDNPEIIELTAQIERAERNADSIASAVAWVKDMQTQEAPSYEVLLPATAERAVPDGNHKKLFVGVFGAVGFLLAMPLLLWDATRSDKTPSEELCREFGLSPFSTHAVETGRIESFVGLQANDPELRLLASRIQRSARDARGSVVLFSSLSDSVSTKELTTTIASCLAAREERVMIVDLEPIDEHRRGDGLKLGGSVQPRVAGESVEPSPRVRSDQVPGESEATDPEHGDAIDRLAADGESADGSELANGNGHAANGLTTGRMGLALALAGGTKDVEDVLVERGDDGIDRLQLGEGELPVEAFASPLMGRLLDRYRNDYSMVLLSGPAAKHIADVQMLASRCDGTMFVAPDKGAIAPNARRTIVDLIENRAPIMGVAHVPA